jgi:hypothetical protein
VEVEQALKSLRLLVRVNVYVQVLEENVMRAVNSHATTVLEGWTPAV